MPCALSARCTGRRRRQVGGRAASARGAWAAGVWRAGRRRWRQGVRRWGWRVAGAEAEGPQRGPRPRAVASGGEATWSTGVGGGQARRAPAGLQADWTPVHAGPRWGRRGGWCGHAVLPRLPRLRPTLQHTPSPPPCGGAVWLDRGGGWGSAHRTLRRSHAPGRRRCAPADGHARRPHPPPRPAARPLPPSARAQPSRCPPPTIQSRQHPPSPLPPRPHARWQPT